MTMIEGFHPNHANNASFAQTNPYSGTRFSSGSQEERDAVSFSSRSSASGNRAKEPCLLIALTVLGGIGYLSYRFGFKKIPYRKIGSLLKGIPSYIGKLFKGGKEAAAAAGKTASEEATKAASKITEITA